MLTKRNIRSIISYILWFSWISDEVSWSNAFYGILFPWSMIVLVMGGLKVRDYLPYLIPSVTCFIIGSCIIHFIRFLIRVYRSLPESNEEREKRKNAFNQKGIYIHLEDGEVAEVIEDDGQMPEKRKRG